jgi:hypothetical protein
MAGTRRQPIMLNVFKWAVVAQLAHEENGPNVLKIIKNNTKPGEI